MKNKFFLAFIAFLMLFSSFAFAQEEEEVPESPAEAPAEAADEKNDSRDAKKRTDSYLGVTYVPVKKLTLNADKVRIALMKNTYSFNIYAVDEAGNAVPVLSNYDDSSSSFIAVMTGKSEYRLNREAGVTAEVRQMEGRCQLAYRIPDSLQLALDFTPVASVKGQERDMVKITMYATNLSKKTMELSVKALLDTILGENTDYHFTTGSGAKIKTEVFYETMRDEKWIMSSNGKTSAQFIFAGKGVPDPIQLTLANKDILSVSSAWRPKVAFDRSFSSVTAYNNSALNVNWAPVKLAPEETSEITFYVALGTDRKEPKGEAFLNSLGFESFVLENEENQEEVAENVEVASAGQVEKLDELPAADEGKPLKRDEPVVEVPVKRSGVDFIVPPITDKQLDLEYIQNLIDRINSLNSDPNLVDRSEVRRLNAELDAILDKIKQKK